MGNGLRSLFEYQKFEQNSRLAELIEDTESRYEGKRISEDDLDMVVAAGEVGSEGGAWRKNEQDNS